MNAALVILVATLFRLIFAGFTGLGIDESYMVAATSHFSASYFDHPLASWWLELAARALFGNADPLIVRLPFILLAALSSWLLHALTHRLYGRHAALWAVIAFNLSPVFSLAFGCWVLPDGPLDAALLAAAYFLVRALGLGQTQTEPAPRLWYLAGFFAGLALLSKYNAALTLAGALLLLLTDPLARRQLRRPEPWAAGLIALALFCPVIAWNFSHHFQSFDYQSARATGLRFRPLMPLTIWGGEALFVLPWLWLPMVILMLAALFRGPAERNGWALACLALPPILLFALVGLWSSTRILYHWAAPGYLMLFPLLGNWATRLPATLRQLSALLTAALLAGAAMLIVAQIQFSLIPQLSRLFPPGKSPLLQAVNWDSIAPQIPRNIHTIAALRWYDAGKIGYALRHNPQITTTVLGPEPHQFGLSNPPGKLTGQTILIAAMPGNITQIANQLRPDFQTLTAGPALTVAHNGQILLVIPTLIGTNLHKTP